MFSPILSFILCLPLVLGAPDWRVINGTEPRVHEFGSVVSVWIRNRHTCGGTLVDDDTVLTAAHCFYDEKFPTSRTNNMFVYINAHDFDFPPKELKKVKVVKIITHPKWNNFRTTYDFQILKLAEKVPESRTVKYSPLPSEEGTEVVQRGDLCYVVGWGTTDPIGYPGSRILQKGAMRIITNKQCARTFRVEPIHVCAASAYVSTSACKGDSGGPLYCFPRSLGYNMTQVGVVSFGKVPCGMRNVPAVYARITEVVDWITENF